MTEGPDVITDFAALRPGCSYRVRHRAGGRVVTHEGELELDTWFASTAWHTTAWGKKVPVRRRFCVYPEEFVSAVEIEPTHPVPPAPRRRRR